MSPVPRLLAIGTTFEHLTVLRCIGARPTGSKRYYLCACDCGATTEVRVDHILAGRTTSCGCQRLRDLQGKAFGDLLVLSRAPNIDSGRSLHHPKGLTAWRCRCRKCGREVIAGTEQLLRQVHPSCGCRYLKPTADRADEDELLAIDAEDAPRRQRSPETLPPLTAEQIAQGWKDTQLGRTRTIARPIEDDDEIGGVLSDGDPFL